MRNRLAVLLAAAAVMGMATATSAADWPQWRGEGRAAMSGETGLSTSWPEGGPRVAWRVDGLGGGHSTPSIAGGRVFVQTNRGTNEERVTALSERSGEQLWATRIGSVGAPDQNPSYPGSRSTPTVDGDRLYAMSSDGDLVCLNVSDGSVIWSHQVRREYNGRLGRWAYAESPLVDGDHVVCTPGGSEATLLSLNKMTGDVVWRAAVPGGAPAAYSSIVIAEIGGVRQYVQFIETGVVGVNAATGEFLWRFDDTAAGSPANIPTPVVLGDRVYSASGRAGGALIRVTNDGGRFSVDPVYAGGRLPNGIGGAVLLDGYLYGSVGQALACIDFETGRIVWQDRSIGAASLVYANGQFYLHGENGELALVDATPEGYREHGRFTPADAPALPNGAKAWSHPVVANGRLYIQEGGTVWAYDIRPAVR